MLNIIETKKEKYGEEENLDIATSLEFLGEHYMLIGEFEKADQHYNQAIDMYAKCYNTDTNDYACKLSMTSLLYQQWGEAEKAIDYIKRSVEIKEKLFGQDTFMMGEAYVE
mmetsp:Transcript_19422/g.16655  ORF Transcript_19422/g.16655 Transcript_19422/m.16655 type:complete len:111 (+) Transcript_19422:1320-1652(+)|eukprot:CAMPEP_0114598376 /NCGR_PEP_ID=MMETSP0125-20121206/20695_1 /TAXON_ID=485358 ORGANISM="Aristerostoma sp., Strain ATCC 50986" /NCGR_SAMPLE_ID=MMETSP0125 /ASSEMBLY_ACC=CAM_ASM_000245 /LENGTH=110 /DNA_ID=CAMNT_0001803943 /DNA_START=725 /DNA_END=1057 /DNA_ORIENTATION=+